MGVLNLFSSDSRDCGYCPPSETVRVNSTPDPTKFEVLEFETVNGYPILMVKYEDVLNYEGVKILMYEKNFDMTKIHSRIDPHFFTNGDSPIARFVPTTFGWRAARLLAKKLP